MAACGGTVVTKSGPARWVSTRPLFAGVVTELNMSVTFSAAKPREGVNIDRRWWFALLRCKAIFAPIVYIILLPAKLAA